MTLEVFLAIGTLLMAASMLAAARAYRIPTYKILIAAVLLTAAGFAGAKLMAFIEAGSWSGKSFFGALFFAPLLMAPVALALRERYADIMDLCAPAECVMLALLKIECVVDGCCYGTILRITAQGRVVRFPSQIAEGVNGLVLMLVLLWLVRKPRLHGEIYPWYMILYGVTRFVLNLFRDTTPFLLGMAAGNFWSLVSIVIGVALLVTIRGTRARRAAA